MFDQTQLLWLGGIFFAAFLVVLIGGVVSRVGLIVVTVGAYFGMFHATTGRELYYPWTPKVIPAVFDITTYGVIVIGLLALLLSARKIPNYVRAIFALVVPFLIVGATIWPHSKGWTIHPTGLTSAKKTEVLEFGGGAALACLLLWWSTESIAVRTKGGVAPTLICGVFVAGVMGLLGNTGDAILFTFLAVPGAVILAAFIGGLLGKRPAFDRGPVFVWILMAGILLGYSAYSSDERNFTWIGVLAAAPLLGWVGQIKPVSKWKPWKRETIRTVFVAIPIVTVLVIATKKSIKSSEETGKSSGSSNPQEENWNQ